ncbi:MAG: HAMP domain-containing sensor histidine kinase [Bacteroidales bacterium]|jgi:two-component system phosphate regulon sensor histidine kinase PhoR|nr:HAMP domain-containing sensor histidine kinase [Bacteroidales bacterium]
MKKRRVSLFIAIAVFAILGIILTQFFWVRDAHQLREEFFDQRAKVALKSVSTQILDAQIDSSAKYLLSPCDTLAFGNKDIREIIDAKLLDSLLMFEFNCLELDKEYFYGVFNERDSAFILGPYEGYEADLLSSKHRVSLTCIYKEDVFYLGVVFPGKEVQIMQEIMFMIVLSLVFLFILIFSFYKVIRLMYRQKKLSEIKSDFINNMTHEFKTPIATISLSSEMLLKSDVNEFPYKTRRYASVIFDENARLQKQVDQVLQLSVLEKGEFKLKLKDVDVHRIIRKMAEHFSAKMIRKGGEIKLHLQAEQHQLRADKTHLTNIIVNLIDNALKYTPEKPLINISTRNDKGMLVLSISDNGIGISPENQKHIFKKLFRVPTGNIHDVKGFGLGLFYVKTMVEAQGGNITVKSELNKGSNFIISLPVK